MEAVAVNTLGVSHLDDKYIYIFIEEDILLLIHAAEAYVKTNTS